MILIRRHGAETRERIAAAHRIHWTPEMDAVLRDLAPMVNMRRVAIRIGVGQHTARRRCEHLGIAILPTVGGSRPGAEKTRAIMRDVAAGLPMKEIAARHGIGERSLYARMQRAARLGIAP